MIPGNFSIVLVKVLRSDLSQGAKNAYAAIGTLIYKDSSYTDAGEEHIARQYNVSVRTFRRHLAELIEARLVKVERAGRKNRYYLLDPEKAQLPGPAEHRSELSGVESEHRPEMSGIEEKHRSELSGIKEKHRSELSGVQKRIYIRHPKEDTKKKAASRMSTGSSKQGAGRKLPGELAARFLKKLGFSIGERRKLLKKYPAGRILDVRSRFKLKCEKSYPKKPRGLVLTMLREDPVKPPEAKAAAAQACEEHWKRKRENEERRADADIFAWLKSQEDCEELKKRAQLHVRTFAQGGAVNKVAAETMLRGFLWKKRRKRERAARNEVPSLSAAQG